MQSGSGASPSWWRAHRAWRKSFNIIHNRVHVRRLKSDAACKELYESGIRFFLDTRLINLLARMRKLGLRRQQRVTNALGAEGRVKGK